MIFVTVGTNEATFERLLRAVEEVAWEEEVVVQTGPAAVQPSTARCVEALPYDEFVGLIRKARLVISHAGVGSVIVALAEGKRPVVVPRLRRYGEAVDDHQLHFARRMSAEGLVVLVENEAELSDALVRLDASPPDIGGAHALADDLRAYIEEALGPGSPGDRV